MPIHLVANDSTGGQAVFEADGSWYRVCVDREWIPQVLDDEADAARALLAGQYLADEQTFQTVQALVRYARERYLSAKATKVTPTDAIAPACPPEWRSLLRRPTKSRAKPSTRRPRPNLRDSGDSAGQTAPRASGSVLRSDAASLLAKMRSGDRHAAADFIMVFGHMIRRRVRGKLGPAMRRLFDSQELLSTVARRLDRIVAAGELKAANEGQLWALVHQIADYSLIEKARVFRGLEVHEREEGPLAGQLIRRLRDAEARRADGPELELELAMTLVGDRDREILALWLMGNDHASIGEHLGLSVADVHKRWASVKKRLIAGLALAD